jgi:tRNA-dihydrouridine synthase A
MMDRTDRHCRFLMRLLSRRALLYSEMVTTGAILFGDRDAHLAFSTEEQPVALQLGGNDPVALAECAAIGEAYGYSEINLNDGCPSDRTQDGGFGACLMADPDRVARSVAAMRRATSRPVTVKCRIGIDDRADYLHLRGFIDRVAGGGCRTFIVHARKAVLTGLSPKQNREIPPLNYSYVYRLKEERPDLEIVINGGIQSLAECRAHLASVDGVMVGRAA